VQNIPGLPNLRVQGIPGLTGISVQRIGVRIFGSRAAGELGAAA